MKHWLSLLPIIGLALGLAACNTVKGAGEDVEDSGEWIQDQAEDDE
jgi:predicted small secreted protein